MAKKQKANHATASYHFFVKRERRKPDSEEVGFTRAEFTRLLDRLKDIGPIDFTDEKEIRRVKMGENIPLLSFDELTENRFFGSYEGAYYGQEYRNTRVGLIDAESLNLRKFYYIVDYRRDGKIVLGVQYLGNFGDYEGLKSFVSRILTGNDSVVLSKSITSLRHEIGAGTPVELKVTLRRKNPKAGGVNIFARSGVFAIKRSEYGKDFDNDIQENLVSKIKGSFDHRRNIIADIMSKGDMMDVSDDDIQDCTVIVRNEGRQYTVHLLGDSNISTKFQLSVLVPPNGILDNEQVKNEMNRILDDVITPGLSK